MSVSSPDPGRQSRPANSCWPDIVAGLSIAGLLLPEAVAYSSLGNLPPQAGIIALFAGLVCYGLFGSSRFAIVSATSSSAAVLAAATASIAPGDPAHRLILACGLVIATGALFLVACMARMGNVTDFISKPVLRGFAFGLALIIILRQCAGMANIHSSHNDLLRLAPDLFGQIALWNWAGLAAGAIAFALLSLLARIRFLPAALITIAAGIIAGRWIGLPRYGIDVVGAIDVQFAPPALPQVARAEWLRLSELAFAMAMILYSESYGSIRSFAMKHRDEVAPNRDLFALGIANLVSGLFQGMPVGAGFSATSANEAAGAGSRLAGGIAALIILAITLTTLPLIAQTPQPVLAAIVIHAVGHSLRISIFRQYFAWHRDRLVSIAAVVSVLLLGVLDGLLVSIAISLFMILRRFSDSDISLLGRLGDTHDFVNIAVHPEAKPVAGMIILRPDEPLFFANAERILNQARQNISAAGSSVQTIILSLEESPDLDGSSLEALQDFMQFVVAHDKKLLLTRLKHPVHEILKRMTERDPNAPLLSGLSVDQAVRIASAKPLRSEGTVSP